MAEDVKRSSLLVVDVQNDFCPGGGLEVPGGDLIVPVINRVAGRFPNVAATQDWHPPGHISFATTHGTEPFQTIQVDGLEQFLWPDHCVAGSRGAAFHPDLDTRPFNLVLRKGIRAGLDSYSAFFENDRTTSTGLEHYLKGLGIRSVYVCGLALDVCVYYTAMDAVSLGFDTHLVRDASRGVDQPEGNLERALERMEQAGVRFTASERLA
ncbi:MAG: bifunctional nicotinamidase/pyrazinamidase [Spirochaetota bacterium]